MDAPSDGAIVLHVAPRDSAQKPTVRQILRWHIPDAIIAFVLGSFAGSIVDACIHR